MATPDPIRGPSRDQSVADLTPEAMPTAVSIGELAEQTGFSEAVLRVWEQRYGWPKPRRLANGYRTYAIELIPLLRAVHEEIKQGKTIGDLLRDPRWSAIFEAGRLPVDPGVTKPRPEWASIPQPEDQHARRLRSQLEEALERGDRGTIARIEAEAGRLRPRDRELAITAVMQYWRNLTAP